MSWLFSQALVEEYSEANSSDGEPFAPLSGTPMPQAFLWRDKTTDAWSRFPSGMMCNPLTDELGEAVLMSFLAAFPAQILVVPERAQASTEKPAGCGDTWPASLAKFDPASSLWRTHQCLLFEDSTECLETFPRWGSMRDGELWELTTPEHLTSGNESGLWPTATVGDSKNAANRTATRHNPNSKHHSGTTLVDAVRMWPTPTVQDSKNTSGTESGSWPTPTANEDAAGTPDGKMQWMLTQAAKSGCKTRLQYERKKDGNAQVADLRFLTDADTTTENGNASTAGSGPIHSITSQKTDVSIADHQTFATPQAPDFRTGQQSRWENPERTRNLNDQIGGQLNPTWVEWLMGWPVGWTDCGASATAKFHQWLRSHGNY
jgi:DNA (cytosine-5)-methyltransferase 1